MDHYGTYWEAIDVKGKDEEPALRSQTASRPGPSQPSRVTLYEGMQPLPSNGTTPNLSLWAGADIFKVNTAGHTAPMRSVMFSNNFDISYFYTDRH